MSWASMRVVVHNVHQLGEGVVCRWLRLGWFNFGLHVAPWVDLQHPINDSVGEDAAGQAANVGNSALPVSGLNQLGEELAAVVRLIPCKGAAREVILEVLLPNVFISCNRGRFEALLHRGQVFQFPIVADERV
jgi:hypothetical protein